MQKVILARELSQKPGVLLANQPSRGLDVGVIEYVHRQLLEMRRDGAAILLFSEDLDEILQLADRVAVIYEGKIMGVVPASEADINQLGLLMSGVKSE